MERPTCPGCGDLLREVIAEQILGKEWDPITGTRLVGSGLWECFCGDCFDDVPLPVVRNFQVSLNERRRDLLGRGSPSLAAVDPEPHDMAILRKLQRRQEESERSAEKRNARAFRCRGPLFISRF